MLSEMQRDRQVAVRLPAEQVAEVDGLVSSGMFSSRAAVIRAGVEVLVKRVRDIEIGEEYQRAYAEGADDGWVGEAGAALAAEAAKAPGA